MVARVFLPRINKFDKCTINLISDLEHASSPLKVDRVFPYLIRIYRCVFVCVSTFALRSFLFCIWPVQVGVVSPVTWWDAGCVLKPAGYLLEARTLEPSKMPVRTRRLTISMIGFAATSSAPPGPAGAGGWGGGTCAACRANAANSLTGAFSEFSGAPRLRGFYALARAPFTPALNIIFV